MNKNISLAIAAVLSLGVVGGAFAATATGTVSPTATVAAACVINSATLSFGTVPGVVQSNVDAAGSININCTAGLNFAITANNGANSGKAKVPGRRAMISGAAATGLDYDLYTSAARTVRLDASSGDILASSGAGGVQAVPLFGRVFAGQTYSEAVGTVSDTVALTITF